MPLNSRIEADQYMTNYGLYISHTNTSCYRRILDLDLVIQLLYNRTYFSIYPNSSKPRTPNPDLATLPANISGNRQSIPPPSRFANKKILRPTTSIPSHQALKTPKKHALSDHPNLLPVSQSPVWTNPPFNRDIYSETGIPAEPPIYVIHSLCASNYNILYSRDGASNKIWYNKLLLRPLPLRSAHRGRTS